MRVARIGCFCCLLFLFSLNSNSQQTPPVIQRDPQAMSLLAQALNAAGGISAVTSVQDFSATGNITYFWASEPVSGPATVRGSGMSNLRLDAQLPDGSRSWLTTDMQGAVKDADGTIKNIQYANAVNLGSLIFPYIRIAVALSEPSYSISMGGSTVVNGRSALLIRVQQTFQIAADPTGDQAKWNTKAFAIDPQSFAVLETIDTMWSEDGRMLPISHEVLFSNLVTTNGLKVPFSVVEKLGGQQTWSLQLSAITFNTGIAASTFQF
jgi:hypothetical protein